MPQLLRLTIFMKLMSTLIQEGICWTTKPFLDYDNDGYVDCNIVCFERMRCGMYLSWM